MEKLIISRRINWKNKVYLTVKFRKNSLELISKIVEDFGGDYFDDMYGMEKLSDYKKWKDELISVVTKKVELDVICGDKFIHLIFWKFPNYDFLNKVLDKYCKFAKPKSTEKSFVKKK
ncbi:MAG: hypothetical protein U9Q06_04450 [Nanoarchaeota archaeon]|nr:hypothetical protein [Nanoarchaeota archaeon]